MSQKIMTATPEAIQKMTPMMAQYHAVKAAHPDCLLFFRMGDFFEMFGQDAVQAAGTLDIALTRRQDIPMCGVPVHAYESYLAKLIRAGFKVAICDQLESPEDAKKRGGYKALVARDVVRIVTAGTLTEDPLLDTRRANNLAAVARAGEAMAIAWADLSTGQFAVQDVTEDTLPAALARIDPSECLTNEALASKYPVLRDRGSIEADSFFDAFTARRRLQERYKVSSLEGFGDFSDAAVVSLGLILGYIERTQKSEAATLNPPHKFSGEAVVTLDPSTIRNLEIFESLNGARKDSLLASLDNTATPMGGRLLAERIGSPSQNLEEINTRLDEIAGFSDRRLRDDVRRVLQGAPDMERALARLALGRGSPRDLGLLRTGGQCAASLRILLNGAQNMPDGLHKIQADLNASIALTPLIDLLEAALVSEPPIQSRDGGFVASGYNPELDEQRNLRDQTRRVMAELQARYIKATGLSSLKIAHNALIGYHIEVSARQAESLLEQGARQDPVRAIFIHRQTMANNVRFTTEELLDLEQKIGRAGERALALELEIFESLRLRAMDMDEGIKFLARTLARLDVAASQAELASTRRYTRPLLAADTRFVIQGGRHPVVEDALAKRGQTFGINDCRLDDAQRLWLITGPNMAGKSTFLRQNALITLMAQAGLYVPATRAEIGIVDRIFSRVGSGDDLSSGRSTFMVEMTETAIILNQATNRSLVIVDEIGRGTATQDGLALARACLEHFHDVTHCRGLFATHFHELTSLEQQLTNLACYNLAVREQAGQIHFLHRVERGAADRSFGVHVAKLAGLPPLVIRRAETLLRLAEKAARIDHSPALPLFDEARVSEPDAKPEMSPALALLSTIDPDALSPKDALETLYRLKSMA